MVEAWTDASGPAPGWGAVLRGGGRRVQVLGPIPARWARGQVKELYAVVGALTAALTHFPKADKVTIYSDNTQAVGQVAGGRKLPRWNGSQALITEWWRLLESRPALEVVVEHRKRTDLGIAQADYLARQVGKPGWKALQAVEVPDGGGRRG